MSGPDSIRVALFEPPAEQRTGGLDLAIRSLERHLRDLDVAVRTNPDLDALDASPPDLVHLHGLWQRPYRGVAAWCRRRGVPYLVSPHGMLEPWAFRHKRWKKWPYFYLVERPLLRGAARLVATAESEADNLRRLTGHPDVAVVPLAMSSAHGPDYAAARATLGWTADEHVLVYLSRVHPKKGLHLLIEALDGLRPEGPVRLVVVGDGDEPYVRELQAAAGRLSAPPYAVDWVGAVWGPEKWHYLQGADLFCLPTHSENFGLAVLEACQVGTPVLTTHETPWGFLEGWGGGLITDPAVPAIRETLRGFFETFTWSDKARAAFAARTRERFDPDRIGRMYLDLYRDVADPARPASHPLPSSTS